MTETLTEEERNALDDITPTFGGKALRIIDQLTRERDEALRRPTLECARGTEAEVARLAEAQAAAEQAARNALDTNASLVQAFEAAEARVRELETLLRQAVPLWEQWRTSDITDDDDKWAEFTNRAHDWHDAVKAVFRAT